MKGVITVIVCFLSFVYFALFLNSDLILVIVGTISSFIFSMIGLHLAQYLAIYIQSKLIKDSRLFSDVSNVYLRNDGLLYEDEERGNFLMKWSDFSRVYESKSVFGLRTKEATVILIPKRDIVDGRENEFRNVLKENIKK